MNKEPISISHYPDGRVDTKNAALYLGLSEKTLATMRCNGTGPQFIKRGRVLYFLDVLDARIAEARKSLSTAQARVQR